MKAGTLHLSVALIVGITSSGLAGTVNCKQVNKYLQTGRSVADVAETMVIEEAEVKKCQEQAAEAGGAKGRDGDSKVEPHGSIGGSPGRPAGTPGKKGTQATE